MAKASSSGDSSRKVLARVEASKAGKVKVAITDLDGILRGKYINQDKFRSAVDGGELLQLAAQGMTKPTDWP